MSAAETKEFGYMAFSKVVMISLKGQFVIDETSVQNHSCVFLRTRINQNSLFG